MICPLCKEKERINFYYQDVNREYHRCGVCHLVFVPEEYHLSAEEEKEIYDLHQNCPDDQGYRRFLSRLCDPLINQIGAPGKGLDFGCGPGPTLSVMLEERGFSMDIYDPLYHNNSSVLSRKYDCICSTEVVEHMNQPGREFDRLFSMLNAGGWLGIMTKMVQDIHAFKNWHYIRDLTHVSFFSRDTFIYIAERYSGQLFFYGSDVILMRTKNNS